MPPFGYSCGVRRVHPILWFAGLTEESTFSSPSVVYPAVVPVGCFRKESKLIYHIKVLTRPVACLAGRCFQHLLFGDWRRQARAKVHLP